MVRQRIRGRQVACLFLECKALSEGARSRSIDIGSWGVAFFAWVMELYRIPTEKCSSGGSVRAV
eukprot:COSAG02_NODE_61024_length_269_cov_1.405882_1_plen_63_part_10